MRSGPGFRAGLVMFFDGFQRFYETRLAGNYAEWSNRHFLLLIERSRELIADKRIVDLEAMTIAGTHAVPKLFACLLRFRRSLCQLATPCEGVS